MTRQDTIRALAQYTEYLDPKYTDNDEHYRTSISNFHGQVSFTFHKKCFSVMFGSMNYDTFFLQKYTKKNLKEATRIVEHARFELALLKR